MEKKFTKCFLLLDFNSESNSQSMNEREFFHNYEESMKGLIYSYLSSIIQKFPKVHIIWSKNNETTTMIFGKLKQNEFIEKEEDDDYKFFGRSKKEMDLVRELPDGEREEYTKQIFKAYEDLENPEKLRENTLKYMKDFGYGSDEEGSDESE